MTTINGGKWLGKMRLGMSCPNGHEVKSNCRHRVELRDVGRRMERCCSFGSTSATLYIGQNGRGGASV